MTALEEAIGGLREVEAPGDETVVAVIAGLISENIEEVKACASALEANISKACGGEPEASLFQAIQTLCSQGDVDRWKLAVSILAEICTSAPELYTDAFFMLLEMLQIKDEDCHKAVVTTLTKQIYVDALRFTDLLFQFANDSQPAERYRAVQYFCMAKTTAAIRDAFMYPRGDELEARIVQKSKELLHVVSPTEWLWIVETICDIRRWKNGSKGMMQEGVDFVSQTYRRDAKGFKFSPGNLPQLQKFLYCVDFASQFVERSAVDHQLLHFAASRVLTRLNIIPDVYRECTLRSLSTLVARCNNMKVAEMMMSRLYRLLKTYLPTAVTKATEVNYAVLECTLNYIHLLGAMMQEKSRASGTNVWRLLAESKKSTRRGFHEDIVERLDILNDMTKAVLTDTAAYLRHLGVQTKAAHSNLHAATLYVAINSVKNVRSAMHQLWSSNPVFARNHLLSWKATSARNFLGSLPNVTDHLEKQAGVHVSKERQVPEKEGVGARSEASMTGPDIAMAERNVDEEPAKDVERQVTNEPTRSRGSTPRQRRQVVVVRNAGEEQNEEEREEMEEEAAGGNEDVVVYTVIRSPSPVVGEKRGREEATVTANKKQKTGNQKNRSGNQRGNQKGQNNNNNNNNQKGGNQQQRNQRPARRRNQRKRGGQ